MFVALEAFLDHHGRQYGGEKLLQLFGEYVDSLGTQAVTVTISSLVEDMLDLYANITQGLQSFTWKQNLATVVEDFVYTRECFVFADNRAPMLEVTFRVIKYHAEELDIDLHFTRNLPLVQFQNLCNVVTEGNEFFLKPSFDARLRSFLPVTAEYFVGPGEGWLQWDSEQECVYCLPNTEIFSLSSNLCSRHLLTLLFLAIDPSVALCRVRSRRRSVLSALRFTPYHSSLQRESRSTFQAKCALRECSDAHCRSQSRGSRAIAHGRLCHSRKLLLQMHQGSYAAC